jgi:predicted lipoprotein with Yx(FWY)xxD motif
MRRLLAVLAATVAVGAGCGTGGSATTSDATRPVGPTTTAPAPTVPSSPTPARSPTATLPADKGVVVMTAQSAYGQMLFDRRGQAIYLFDKETTSRPECYGACATAWPPVLTKGPPVADGLVRADLLGTTDRRDGSTQVTYAGRPLYYYAHERPHEVLCHNVTGFGGLWLVVTPSGAPAD